MSIFRRSDYTSDVTQFIESLKAERPSLPAEQRVGRSLLWDKALDDEEQAEFAQARVAQKPYVYGTGKHPNAR